MRKMMGMLVLLGLAGMLFASGSDGGDDAGVQAGMGVGSGETGDDGAAEIEASSEDEAETDETEVESEAGTRERGDRGAESGNEASDEDGLGEQETDDETETESDDINETEDEDADDARAAAVRQMILEKRYAQIGCRAAFLYSMMDSAELHGNVSLAEERAAVDAAMEQLGARVEAGEFVSYSQSMDETRNAFAVAVREAKGAQMDALRAADDEDEEDVEDGAAPGDSERVRARTRTELRNRMRAEYDASHEAFVSCMHEAVRERVRAELDEFSGWHADGEEIADSMEGRGYNASRMRETLDEADDSAEELEAAVDSNMTTEQIVSLRSEKWGHEFYLWAQFHKERINLLLDRFEEKTDGYEAEVAGIRETLDDAASVGDDEIYTLEEAQESKALVNQAMQEFSALVGEARGGA